MSSFLTELKAKIPGTQEHEDLIRSQQMALEVMHQWESGELVYSSLKNRIEKNRDFYLGKNYVQFNQLQVEGELRITANVGATVIDLITYLLSNSPPSVQAKPTTNDKIGQVEASLAEDLANKSLRRANFHKKFRDSAWLFLIGGFIWWYPFWNNDKKFGKRQNKFDFSMLNPLTTRVFYKTTDFDEVAHFITTKRMLPEDIYDMYDGFEARPDRENVFLPRDISGEGIEDGKVTVFKRYDAKYVTTVIDGRVADTMEHDFDFTPLIQMNNKYVLNEAHGRDDVFRMLPIAQELNMLLSAASEIARDLAWPPLLEYNAALGGKKIPKLRGVKIPVRRTDKGEALEYLVNPAQMEPLLRQIQMLLDLFHFVALMPKAAAGIFESSVTSGFQARIAMQPATLSTENKRIDLEAGIVMLVKSALYLIEKNNPKALQIDENTRIQDLHDLDFDVVWPDNLPVDIAREIQNLILGIQNSLTSVTQAVDRYNVLMGFGSSEETMTNLRNESKEPDIAPDRALKVAQVSQALAQIDQSMSAIRDQLGVGVTPEDVLPGGNQTNAERAAGGTPQDQQQVVPDTAREAVPPESTNGEVITP